MSLNGEVKEWFEQKVTYEGEPYTIDAEQAAAVADVSKNTIVVARAGSGKTRTIVAKVVYMVARLQILPEEIMIFVFNANAAAEINARLAKMMVAGKPIMAEPKIASTFHAFSRKIVYEICGGKDRCGEILVDDKERLIRRIVVGLMGKKAKKAEVDAMAKRMTGFIDRAQQKYLAGEQTLAESARARLVAEDADEEEREFIELGLKCYRRYHWLILNAEARKKFAPEFAGYGTDFNLIVSWASRLISRGSEPVRELICGKKFILIDEYQDFSQLFLSVVLAIREIVPEVKLFVVGDDWQAINRFAGSEVEYFKEFERYFPEEVRRLTISTNYRCDYMIVDTARKFMKKAMGETGDFRAKSRRAGEVVLVNPAETRLVDIIRRERKAREILILHRNNETHLKEGELSLVLRALRRETVRQKIMDGAEFDEKVHAMTMHKSKGLEAEVVIILEADEGVIPKAHPDVHLMRIFGETEEVELDDQKRLFYVAMTRAKRRLYIIHKNTGRRASGFIKYLGRGVEKWED